MNGLLKPLAIAGLLGSIFALACTDLADYDLWFHLSYGRELLKLGHFPDKEIFLLAAPDVPMTNPEWLFDLLAYALWALCGPGGIVVMKAAVFTGIFGVMLGGAVAERKNLVIALSVLFLAGLSWRVRFIERPEIIGLLAMSAAIHLLRTAATRRPGPLLLSLVAIQVVWVNCHASALILPFVAALYIYAGYALFRASKRWNAALPGALDLSGSKILLLVPPVLAAATFLNPFTYQIHAHFLAFQSTTVYKHTISELMPLKLFKPGEPLTYFLAAWAAGCVFSWRRLNLADLIAGVVFLLIARDALRFLPFFLVVAAPTAALGLSDAWARLSRTLAALRADSRWASLAGAGALVLIAAGMPLLSAHAMVRTYNAKPGFGVFPFKFPQGCVAYLKDNGIKANLLNTFHLGGYLEWAYFPDGRPLFDGRATQVREDLLTRLNLAEQDPAVWSPLSGEFAFDAAVLENPLMKSRHAFIEEAYYANWRNPAPPGWAMVYWDDTCIAFVKREAYPQVASRDEYFSAMPVQHEQIDVMSGHGAAGHHATAMMRAGQEKELLRNIDRNPSAVTPRIFLARILSERKEYAAAIRVLSEVEDRLLVPDANVIFGGGFFSLMGSLSLAENDVPRAVVSLERAVRSSPHNVDIAVALGDAYLRAGRTKDGERVLRGIANGPKLNLKAIQILRTHYRATGKEQDASNLDNRFESAMRLATGEAHFTTATNLYKARRYEEAIEEYKKSLGAHPASVPTKTNIGYLHYDLGRMDEAISWFNEALAIEPGWPEAHYGLGLAHEKKGEPAQALDHFQKYLKATPRGYYSKKAEDKLPGLKRAIEEAGR
ncbi:MAG: tetratricopeptide repeat protein [Deltaproteobacteria bacterium]|nr:tetratricopeptide repeat protein [Deltaproteobacteria bacterium]